MRVSVGQDEAERKLREADIVLANEGVQRAMALRDPALAQRMNERMRRKRLRELYDQWRNYVARWATWCTWRTHVCVCVVVCVLWALCIFCAVFAGLRSMDAEEAVPLWHLRW